MLLRPLYAIERSTRNICGSVQDLLATSAPGAPKMVKPTFALTLLYSAYANPCSGSILTENPPLSRDGLVKLFR